MNSIVPETICSLHLFRRERDDGGATDDMDFFDQDDAGAPIEKRKPSKGAQNTDQPQPKASRFLYCALRIPT